MGVLQPRCPSLMSESTSPEEFTVNRFRVQSMMTGLVAIVAIAGCSSAPVRDASMEPAERVEAPERIVSIAERDGTLFVASGSAGPCIVTAIDLSSSETEHEPVRTVDACPERMDFDSNGQLVLFGPGGQLGMDANGLPPTTRYATRAGDQIAFATDERIGWSRSGMTILSSPFVAKQVKILDEEDALLTVGTGEDGDTIVRWDWSAENRELVPTVLVTPLERIDEIEVDRDQKELAISAVKNDSDDIAIVNAERPAMNWVPYDPADEVKPRWSPVGYKLSYIVRNPGGDILRTVHVPTAAMVLADFPDATIRDYTWLSDGERVLVALSSPLVSDHVVEVTYEGSTKKTVVPPALHFDRTVDRVPGTPPGSLFVLPDDIRYTERHPLVVWVRGSQSPSGLSFDPNLVPFLQRVGAGLVIVNGESGQLGEGFWSALDETRWIDPGRIWLVVPNGARGGAPPGITVVDPNDAYGVESLLSGIDQRGLPR